MSGKKGFVEQIVNTTLLYWKYVNYQHIQIKKENQNSPEKVSFKSLV